MTIEMKKVWFDGEKVVTQNIIESDIYKRHWDIASCKAYAEQLRDKNRANTAEHAAEAIEYLLALAQPKEQEPVAWITPDGEGFRIRFSPPVNDVPLGWDALYTTPPQRKPLTDEEILEVWKENEKVYPMDRSRLLDRTRACIRKAQIEVGCAECGVNGGYALYCVECAEKFIGEADTKLQQKQETIEGLNRDYDLLFAEYQLLRKKEWVGLSDEEIEQGCKESWVTKQAFQSAVWWAEDKLKDKNNNAKT